MTGSVATIPEDITAQREIQLDLSRVEGATRFRVAERPDDVERARWVPFQDSIQWTLSGPDGLKVIDLQLANEGRGSLRLQVEIMLAIEPPTGTFSINHGAEITDTVEVDLCMVGIEGAERMRFGNDVEELKASSFETFERSIGWVLEDGEGLRTVFGEFEDRLGRVLETSASITIDSNAPGGYFTIDGGATHTNDPNGMVHIDLSRITNAEAFRLANEVDSLESTGWREMTVELDWTLSPGEGPKTVKGEFRGASGLTNVLDADIIYDVTPPEAPNVTVEERTGNRSPTWFFEARDAAAFLVTFDPELSWTEVPQQSYTSPEPLPHCNESYTLHVRARDVAGNSSPTTASTVFVHCRVAGSVTLHDPGGGDVFLLLLDEEEYTSDDSDDVDPDENRWAVVPASNTSFVFEDISDGEWILLGFQDNDGTGELSLGLFGAPVDPWGTYVGESSYSPVSFEEGHFVIDRDDREDVVLRLSGFHW